MGGGAVGGWGEGEGEGGLTLALSLRERGRGCDRMDVEQCAYKNNIPRLVILGSFSNGEQNDYA